MCGIAGIIHRNSECVPSRDELLRMAGTLSHRGPDAQGIHIESGVGLAHRRLIVIDPRGSSQPLTNEEETIHLTYNGEIYNYRELRRELVGRGHTFRTRGDSEILVHLWEDEGPAMLSRLNGMFAFALWDRSKQMVFLARDRLGIKPLYWFFDGNRLVFGSEIKAILAASSVPREVNREALPQHLLFNTLYGEETLFQGIRELLPGHHLMFRPWRESQPRLKRWWDLPEIGLDAIGEDPTETPEETPRTGQGEEKAAEAFRSLLGASVERRLVADVPVGVFLSGGLDSSILTALAADKVSGPLQTFSIGFDEEEGNEFSWSRRVAKQFRTDHHEITLNEDDFLGALPALIWHNDEPIKHNNSIPLYFLSRETKSRATVILTGEGSDELFLGYRKYRLGLILSRIGAVYRSLLPARLGKSIVEMGPRFSRRKWATRFVAKLNDSPALLAASSSAVMDRCLLEGLAPGLVSNEGAQPYLSSAFSQGFPGGGGDFLRRYSRMDLKAYLVSLLTKQDRMSMAASIESRVPFLDHELVEWAYRLPSSLKLRGTHGKWLVKKAVENLLPADLIHRRKLGFPVPVYGWLTKGAFRELAKSVLLDRRSLDRGIVDRIALETYFEDLESGVYGRGVDATYPIWTLLNLELWWRTCIEGTSFDSLETPQSNLSVPDGLSRTYST